MSAFDQIMNIFKKSHVDVQVVSDTELQIWTHPSEGTDENGATWEYPASWNASIIFDDCGAISGITTHFDATETFTQTAIGQLANSLKLFRDILRHEGGWDELNELKLHYRKVGKLVEVDIVSYHLNWWNYEKNGVKVQSLFSTEFHEGPDLEEVEATLVFDPATNKLQAR